MIKKTASIILAVGLLGVFGAPALAVNKVKFLTTVRETVQPHSFQI